jgi:hypothetical protein
VDPIRVTLPPARGQLVLLEVPMAARAWRGRAVDSGQARLRVRLDEVPGPPPGTGLWACVQDVSGVYCFSTRVIGAPTDDPDGGSVELAPPATVHHTDERRHSRTEGEVPVVLRVLGPEGIVAVESVAVSLGAGGVRVHTEHPMAVGDPVGLTLALTGDEPVSGVGRIVARRVPDTDLVLPCYHVELTDLDEAGRDRLTRWVVDRLPFT